MNTYDLVILNGTVLDPETKTHAVLNVAIQGEKIACVGPEIPQGRRVINAAGLVVAPGFIDIHAHEDSLTFSSTGEYPLPTETSAALLHTGVTTMIGGNCGFGAFPVGTYLQAVEKAALPLNYYTLAGYISLRHQLGIDNYQSASEKEIAKLLVLVEQGLQEGALGVSFGLQYAPGISTREVIAAAGIVKKYDKIIAVHMRYDYPQKAIETVKEIIEVAEKTGVSVQISHLPANVYGGDNLERVLELLEQCNQKGMDIRADAYPYNVWATSLKSSVFDQGVENFNFSLQDIEILTGPHAEKRCTAELFAELRNQEEDTLVACHNAMPPEDLERAIRSPLVSIGSDGQLCKDENGDIKGHPRSAGSPARLLGEFVRKRKLIDLDEAIRKITLEPANRLQLSPKGRLQQGKDADITIFDFNEITDRSRFGINVCALPAGGIKYVIVQGKTAWET